MIAEGIWFGKQLTVARSDLEKERANRDKDRSQAMEAAAKRSDAFDALANSHSKFSEVLALQLAAIAEIKGILIILGNRRQ